MSYYQEEEEFRLLMSTATVDIGASLDTTNNRIPIWDDAADEIKYVNPTDIGGGGFSVTNEADNRIITSLGVGLGGNAESGLTFDGTTLQVVTAASGTLVKGFQHTGTNGSIIFYDDDRVGFERPLMVFNATVATSNPIFAASVGAESFSRASFTGDGAIQLGNGSATWDTRITNTNWSLGTASPTEEVEIVASAATIKINNTNAASGAQIYFYENATWLASLLTLGPTFGTVNRRYALEIATRNASGVITFRSGNNVEAARFTSAGDLIQNTTTSPTGTTGAVFVQGDNGGNPTPGSNTAAWYCKDVSGTVTPHCVDEAGNIWVFSQQAALTTQLTTITHTAPGTPDYALQDLVDSGAGSAFGFATKDEGNTLLSVVANLQARVAELESKLQTLGALA